MKLHPCHIIFFAALIYFQCCTAKSNDDALWLARSCIGEAGWNSHETGECAALLHLYKKRAKPGFENTVKKAQEYSAAIKPRRNRENPWVMHLRGTDKPKRWPINILWPRYIWDWLQTKFVVSLFKAGRLADPLPESWHYGCAYDTPPKDVVRIKTNFRNRWYRRKNVKQPIGTNYFKNSGRNDAWHD